MDIILYNMFVRGYALLIRISSIWNKKAALWIRGRKEFPEFRYDKKTIWMHCASLGEFEQGRPVLDALKKEFPDYPVIVSFFSPSGYELRKNDAIADKIIYLPIDTPGNANKLIRQINPALVLWVKYEYWYHYLTTLKQQQVPLMLVSGIFRKNQPFFKWYGGLWKKILSAFTRFFLQNESSAILLKSTGIENNIQITGDTRFDRVIEIAESNRTVEHIAEFVGKNQVLVAGSTWKEDHAILIKYIQQNPQYRYIIAPHEIKQASLDLLKSQLTQAVFYAEYSAGLTLDDTNNVLIIDNIGMLADLYKYASVAYIGGGFNKSGIHNTTEAAVYGKPVIFGPHYKKFEEATALVNSNAAFSIRNEKDFERILNSLFGDNIKLEQAGKVAREIIYRGKGATGKIIDYVMGNRLLTR